MPGERPIDLPSMLILNKWKLSFHIFKFVIHSALKSNFFIKSKKNYLSCTGPEQRNCIKCRRGYDILGTAPNKCLKKSSTCNLNCESCYGSSYFECLSCSETTEVELNGKCYARKPEFWNKITFESDKLVFYGFDKKKDLIYIRI